VSLLKIYDFSSDDASKEVEYWKGTVIGGVPASTVGEIREFSYHYNTNAVN